MKQVILTTVAVDEEEKGKNLMMGLFNRLCFILKFHGEVEAGGKRCIVDCDEETAYRNACDLQRLADKHFRENYCDINKLLIRVVEI